MHMVCCTCGEVAAKHVVSQQLQVRLGYNLQLLGQFGHINIVLQLVAKL